ncbi:MAG: PQQ-binding-like beta-propeller repeat protein [Phycisphaerae bacterium]|nr:PQQ-binding-like beta-propeller repeat protein [Phycisphaerae bacterium]
MRIALVSLLTQFLLVAQTQAKDWPQHKGDPARSSISTETLKLPLRGQWVFQPAHTPRPAWTEPGKEATRLDFDYAPQPVVADGRVFFCSSADDTVRALNIASGRVLWRFTTGGPLRFAPAVADGRIYVASDDGCVYCLDAEKGNLVWRFRAAPADDLLIGNGRMVSRWPLRSGVIVCDDLVYTVAGMWPTEGIYVYALDAKTGKVRWRNDSTGVQYVELPHPGATGFSGVAPQGYLAVSDDVLLVPTGRSCPAAFDRHSGKFLYCWPHRNWYDAKRGGCWLTTGAGLYFNPTREIRGTSESYVGECPYLPKDGMVAYDVKTNQPVFVLEGKHRVLVAGDTLFAVGNGEAAAYDLAALRAKKPPAKAVKWTAPHPRVYSMALAGNLLLIGGKAMVTALDARTGQNKWYQTRDIPGPVRGLAVARGSVVVSTDQGIVACFGPVGGGPRTVDDSPDWRLTIPNQATTSAKKILKQSGKRSGYALIAGSTDPALAAALAMNSKLHVVQAVQGENQAAEARSKLMQTDLYGPRVAIVSVDDVTQLPLAPYFADIVVIAGKPGDLSGRELYRILRPCGGVLIAQDASSAQALIAQTGAPAKEIVNDGKGHPMIVRGPLPGAGEWRHQWADGGRSGIGQESRLTAPLELLWFGGPGPDRMMDRHYGSSPPLSVAGRVFVTGEHDLIAYDAYNGRELWARPMRGVGKRGAMWGAANIVADDDMLYVTIGSACYRIDQATGQLAATFAMPEPVSKEPFEWSYVEVAGDLLLGCCSRNSVIFALDKRTGSLRWQWQPRYRVPATTIAFGDGRLYCLDLQPPDEKARRRGIFKPLARELVALNLTDGKEIWRQEGVPKVPTEGVQFARGVVAVYANAAYDAATGKNLWQKAVAPERPPLILGDWLIAQPNAYRLRTGEQRMTADATTGREVPWEYIQSYGCGGVAGCQTMLFFRSAVAGFYDFKTDGTTTFGGIRVGCSINMIAAAGLAIVPETSSGCPCSYNFQTSLALAPVAEAKPDAWFVFAGQSVEAGLSRARINFGAPGDRLDPDGTRWLSIPRPILRGAVPIKVNVSSDKAEFYVHPREDDLAGLDKPWLYASGVRNPGRITVDLLGVRPIVAPKCDKPMTVDGKLDPSLIAGGAHAPIPLTFTYGMRRKANLYLRHDNDNLYVAIQCRAEPPKDGKNQWAQQCTGQDARVWEDDSWEVYLSDRSRKKCVHLGVSASGARFDGVWDYDAYDPLRALDRKWNGPWKSAAATDDKTMTVELAVPLQVLQDAGLKPSELYLNVLGTGPGALGSPDFLSVQPDGFCVQWRGFVASPADGAYTFTIRSDQQATLSTGDKVLINHKGTGKPTESSATLPMKAGQRVPIEMVYTAARGPALAQLFWSGPSTPKAIVPSAALYTADGKPGGLTATYSNQWFEEPILERIDPTIAFDWPHEDPLKAPRAELIRHGGQRPRRCETFMPLAFEQPKVPGTYTVRLHFAETDDAKPGQRLFDVKIQDKPVLQAFDVAQQAGGRNRPVIKECKNVSVGKDARIAIELTPSGAGTNKDKTPTVSAMEIIAE